MNKYRRITGDHIVRVAYSLPTRRVTYGDMSLTWTFIDQHRIGPRRRTWLTATVTATRTDADARRRTPKGPCSSPLDVVEQPPQTANDYLRAARAHERRPADLTGATRHSATAPTGVP